MLDLALAQAFRGRSLIQIRLVETALLAKKDDGGQIDDESMGVSMGGAWREYGREHGREHGRGHGLISF